MRRPSGAHRVVGVTRCLRQRPKFPWPPYAKCITPIHKIVIEDILVLEKLRAMVGTTRLCRLSAQVVLYTKYGNNLVSNFGEGC